MTWAIGSGRLVKLSVKPACRIDHQGGKRHQGMYPRENGERKKFSEKGKKKKKGPWTLGLSNATIRSTNPSTNSRSISRGNRKKVMSGPSLAFCLGRGKRIQDRNSSFNREIRDTREAARQSKKKGRGSGLYSTQEKNKGGGGRRWGGSSRHVFSGQR